MLFGAPFEASFVSGIRSNTPEEYVGSDAPVEFFELLFEGDDSLVDSERTSEGAADKAALSSSASHGSSWLPKPASISRWMSVGEGYIEFLTYSMTKSKRSMAPSVKNRASQPVPLERNPSATP